VRRLLLERWRAPRVYAALCSAEARLFGRKLRLEVCSKCQLKCPTCATAHGDTRRGVVGWGDLTPENLTRLLGSAGRVRELELSNWGEIFLNPRLPELLACAESAGVPVTVTNGVNLNTASDASLEAVVRHRVRRLTVSIDGATQETYAKFRVHGNLARVLAHVDRINHFKRLHGSPYPRLRWQFIVFGHNEHEVEAARALAKARGMQFEAIRNLAADYAPVRDPSSVAARTGIDYGIPTDSVLDGLADGLGFCHQVWDAPQVNWDGELLGCCFNVSRSFGNAFETPLRTLLKGPDYLEMQRVLTGRAPLRADLPCASCRLLPRHVARH